MQPFKLLAATAVLLASCLLGSIGFAQTYQDRLDRDCTAESSSSCEIVAKVSNTCPPCNRWKATELAEVLAKGYAVRFELVDSGTVPRFEVCGVPFEGYLPAAKLLDCKLGQCGLKSQPGAPVSAETPRTCPDCPKCAEIQAKVKQARLGSCPCPDPCPCAGNCPCSSVSAETPKPIVKVIESARQWQPAPKAKPVRRGLFRRWR